MDSNSHRQSANSSPRWSVTQRSSRSTGCKYLDSNGLIWRIRCPRSIPRFSIALRLEFANDPFCVDLGRWRIHRGRRPQRRDRVLRIRAIRPIAVCLAPFIDDALQIPVAGNKPRCRGFASTAALGQLAQTLLQVPREGRKLVLVKVRCEWKDPAISRLQKSHDAVHEPVVESLLRIDLRHTPPLAA